MLSVFTQEPSRFSDSQSIRLSRIVGIACLTVLMSSAAGADEEWGSIKARFVYDGEPPEREELVINKDQEVCGDVGLRDESLIVNTENRGIANVVVRIHNADDLPIHPALRELPEEPVILDNKDCRFEPRVIVLRTGQTLQVTNSDPTIQHSAALLLRRNDPISVVVSAGSPLEREVRRPEKVPTPVKCAIHSWMNAWAVVSDHPYATVSDADGRIELKNLPVGKWTVQLWHERSGYIQTFRQGDNAIELSRGEWEIEVKPGETDLGDLVADSEQFAEDN